MSLLYTQKIWACAGTRRYAAPEVLTPLVSYGPSVDIYSYGLVLLFLFTGYHPTSPDLSILRQQQGSNNQVAFPRLQGPYRLQYCTHLAH